MNRRLFFTALAVSPIAALAIAEKATTKAKWAAVCEEYAAYSYRQYYLQVLDLFEVGRALNEKLRSPDLSPEHREYLTKSYIEITEQCGKAHERMMEAAYQNALARDS
jgi:hypothetical protein